MERYIRLVLDPSTCKQVSVSSAQLRFDYGNFGGLLANLLRDDALKQV